MAYSSTINNRSQDLNFRPNNNKTLAASTSHSTRTTRLLVSLAAVLLVIAAAGFGMLFAWQVGSQHDAVLFSVAMALGLEISKPFAISSAFASPRQWRVMTAAALTLVGILAVRYSLQAELTFMSTTRGDLVAERASVRDAAQRAEAHYQKAIASLDELKPVSNKERDMNAYLARREALQSELRTAEQDRRQVPAVVADPGATALAAYAGSLGAKIDPATLGLWLPLIGVLALELGAAFSVVLVRSVAGAQVAHVAHAHSAGGPVARDEAPGVNNRESAPPAKRAVPEKRATKRRRDDDDDDQTGPRKRGLSGFLDAVRANGGFVDLSQRRLAREIGVSRRTLQRAMGDLAAAGALMLETGKSGTRLALA